MSFEVVVSFLQDLLNDYVCVCEAGWESKNCDVETNECDPNPCVNGATCVVSNSGMLCDTYMAAFYDTK